MKTSLLDQPKASLSRRTLLRGTVLIAILLMPSMHARAQSVAPAKTATQRAKSSIGSTKPVDRAVISNEGYVGIGTTVPQAMLHVAGDVGGVAEDYPSSEKLEPGDVVRIDDNAKTVTITKAAKSYDQ